MNPINLVIVLSLIITYCVIMIANWHRMINFVKFWLTIGNISLICLIINDMSEVFIIVPIGFFCFHVFLMLLCSGPDPEHWM